MRCCLFYHTLHILIWKYRDFYVETARTCNNEEHVSLPEVIRKLVTTNHSLGKSTYLSYLWCLPSDVLLSDEKWEPGSAVFWIEIFKSNILHTVMKNFRVSVVLILKASGVLVRYKKIMPETICGATYYFVFTKISGFS